jgi:phospholipid-binding lipoprotein MlaA
MPLLALAVLAGTLAGCATSGNPKDPIEGFNRGMFAVNDALDKAVIKPVAKGFVAAVPQPVRNGVANFYGNIADVGIGVNDALQGKVPYAINDFGRVMVNSTLGILGFMDVASDLGVEKHEEDFGLTLAHWGVGNGAYIVLPVFGPRTVRDSFGLAVDMAADPVGNYSHISTRNILIATRLIDNRASLLPAEKVIDEAAMDKYSYLRDAYLQRRRYLIYDGHPPHEDTPID